MKRFTWIILSVICLFWLVACGNFVTESSDTQVSETTDMNIKENDISNMIKEDSEKQESTVNVNSFSKNFNLLLFGSSPLQFICAGYEWGNLQASAYQK